ncbi:MAG TPA: response regulator [Acidobacteriaceae bacterium]|jgi:CheY-like chemotaxis protein
MGHRVLIVDDDRMVADTLRLVFIANGFDSEACYSAAEALRKARSFAPELMLCDVMMPGENGLDLAAEISREMPRTQVIVLTAYLSSAASAQLEALRKKCPLKLLSKPCRPELLVQEAQELLASQRYSAAS